MEKILSFVFAFALISSPAFAQTASDPKTIPVLQTIASTAKDVSFEYLGKAEAADLWLVTGKRIMQTVYVLPNGQAIVGGLLVDAQGNEISTRMQQEFARANPDRAGRALALAQGETPPPAAASQAAPTEQAAPAAATPPAMPPPSTDALWDELYRLGLIAVGKNAQAPLLYAALDPAQDESKKAYAKLKPLADKGVIALRIIPMSNEVPLQVAQVLGSMDPASSWDKLIAGKMKPGGMPNADGAARLKSNNDFAQKLHIQSAPFFLYRQIDNNAVRAVKGLPKDWSAMEGELGLKP